MNQRFKDGYWIVLGALAFAAWMGIILNDCKNQSRCHDFHCGPGAEPVYTTDARCICGQEVKP